MDKDAGMPHAFETGVQSMVVRRMREHIVTHNWFAVAIDFAIVVAGVLLAMQVSNWNDARVERELAGNYRSRLITELRSDEAQISQKILYYEAVKRHGLALLNSLEKPSAPLGAPFLVDAYQLTQDDPARGKRFIFDEMKSAGMLRMLGSDQDQSLASNFYQQLELYDSTVSESFPYRDVLREEMPYVVQTAIRTNCGDREVNQGGKFLGIALPEECAIRLSPHMVAEAVVKVRAIPNLVPLATRYLSSVDQKLKNFRDTLAQATELREALSQS
jgi:hypothetical protein